MGAVGSKVQKATAEIERVFSQSATNRATRRNQARANRRARLSSRKRGVSNAVGRVGKFAKNLGMGIFDAGRKVIKGVARRAGNVVDYARKGTVRSYANRLHSAQSRATRRRAKARVSELMKEISAKRKRALNPFYAVSVPRSARSASAKSASAKSASAKSARSASTRRREFNAAFGNLPRSARSASAKSARSASTRRREFNALFGNLPRSARRVAARNLSPAELRRRRLARFDRAAAPVEAEAVRNLSPAELRRRRLARFAPEVARSSASRRAPRLNPNAPAFAPAGTRSVRAGRLNLASPGGKL